MMMRRFIGLLGLGMMWAALNVLPAQAQKIGYINSEEILTVLPDYKRAQSRLEQYGQSLEKQLETLMNEYKKKLEDYQANAANLPETVRRDKELEILQLEDRIQKFQLQAQQDVLAKKQELLEPILKKINQAIQQVAQEKGYSYVLDISMGTVLYADPKYDVTALVKRKLGIAASATPKQ